MRVTPVRLSALMFSALLFLTACGSTSTPDLKLIMILHCGADSDACTVEDDNACSGRGRWGQFRDSNDIVVNDNADKLVTRHEIEMGTFDSTSNTCTFSEDISMKSSTRYRIYIDDLGPFDVLKSTLEDQKWNHVLEFNN